MFRSPVPQLGTFGDNQDVGDEALTLIQQARYRWITASREARGQRRSADVETCDHGNTSDSAENAATARGVTSADHNCAVISPQGDAVREHIAELLEHFPNPNPGVKPCWQWFLAFPDEYVPMLAEMMAAPRENEFRFAKDFLCEYAPRNEYEWAGFRIPALGPGGPEDPQLCGDQQKCFRIIIAIQKATLLRTVHRKLRLYSRQIMTIFELQNQLLELAGYYPMHVRDLLKIVPLEHAELILERTVGWSRTPEDWAAMRCTTLRSGCFEVYPDISDEAISRNQRNIYRNATTFRNSM